MNEGIVTPETEYKIEGGSDANCETAYYGTDPDKKEEVIINEEKENVDWTLAATEVISVQFTMQFGD